MIFGTTRRFGTWRSWAKRPSACQRASVHVFPTCRGAISPAFGIGLRTRTMRSTTGLYGTPFNAACLRPWRLFVQHSSYSGDAAAFVEPDPLTQSQIKKIREKARLSQAVFARWLNTSSSTVEKWEIGAKRPGGLALKMLAVVKKQGLTVLD